MLPPRRIGERPSRSPITMFDYAAASPHLPMRHYAAVALLRMFVIGLTAFLAVVDWSATEAIRPSLVKAYRVSPAAMGFAVNASTMGMAVAGLVVALFSRRIDRRRGILISLALLSIPTALLATAPDLMIFTTLRIIRGIFMATAFTLTPAYLGEECGSTDAAGAFVFAPSVVTTLLAGNAVRRIGARPTFWGALAIAGVGLPLLLAPSLAAVLAGLSLVGVGTFFAQATATGFVGQAATIDRGSASGGYLACYFFGGLFGRAVLGQDFVFS